MAKKKQHHSDSKTMVANTAKSSTAQVCLVEPNLLGRAVNALLKYHSSEVNKEGNKKLLLGGDQTIHVQFNLTRIPEHSSISARPIRIEIPHSMNKLNNKSDDNDNLEEAEVCLIVKDSSKDWVQSLIAQFPKEMSYIKKVLSLTSLRKKYTQYQDRRNLCNTYSLFLVDDAILPMVGKLLGKTFFMKKKQPVPLKLSRKEALPFAIEKCIRSTFLMIGAGTCLSIKAAATTMTSETISDNIQAVVQNAMKHIPRKVSNVSSISIKTDSSIALPIYNKVPEELKNIQKLAKVDSSNNVQEQKGTKKRELDQDDEEEDVKDGTFKKKHKKVEAAKSPLLKALKKSKRIEKKVDGQADDTSKKIVKEKKQTKGKKRTSSEIESKEKSTSNENMTADSPKKVKSPSVEKSKSIEKQQKLEEVKGSNDSAVSKEKPDFIASEKFKGPKKGYVFKRDKKGVGYYIDKKPMPDRMAFAALQQSRKGKGRRQSTGKAQKIKGSKKKRRSSY